MATFRSGFKIFGELTLRQSLGRIRSFSEDRKPGSWLPEDQWAVRPPCTTCPHPCAPKKPKASKSWLSICRDPEPPLTCDIRHNNCPPPKEDEPWYAFLTKKKREKPKPPLSACREELQRQAEMPDEEDTCENMGKDLTWPEYSPPCPPCPLEEPICKERQPAPVIRLSCPPPKELDLMLWCGRPGLSVSRIASQCQSDRMPYDEFRPRKCWKPPPYSLPCKSEAPAHPPYCCNVGRAPLAEFKQVEIPKPVYTRYKSVELEDENFLLCMTDARCPPDDCGPSLALEPPPIKKAKPPPEERKQYLCPEKPILVAASRKPVKLKCAPKFKFRPRTTKLVERKHFCNPCAQHKACDLKKICPPQEEKPIESKLTPLCSGEPPKVITSNITNEPQTYQRVTPSKKPPLWMFVLSKPGSKDTPLIPHLSRYPKEPDWCGETDGLKFYDGKDDGITPKPPPDPCKETPEPPSAPPPRPPKPTPKIVTPPPVEEEKFVLMPDKYNIRNMRPVESKKKKDLSEATFQQFIDAKTADLKKCSKLFPQAKESILYDFVRNCPLPPLDPSKPDPPPRRPPEPECPQPTRFYYRKCHYSTFSPFRKPNYTKHLNRMKSEDSRDKCKPRKLVPKPKDCPPPVKGPSCDEMTLPCCPKAKIPPRCDVKKEMPPCKKKLAPKPSYSECSKDPPPCPRNTECNAWEKRDMENQKKAPSKGRKYSTWAPEEGYRGSQNANADSAETLKSNLTIPGPSPDVNERKKSLNKNKRTSHMHRKFFSGKELMLNFVNPADDSDSYYTSENLVKRRKLLPRKNVKTTPEEEEMIERSSSSQLHERKVIGLLLQALHTRNDVRAKNLRISHRESGLGVYVDNIPPGSIIGSIGSWIDETFLKARGKRSHSAPPSLIGRNTKTYVETVDVDRIMTLTKPFRHRIKSADDKVKYCTVDPLARNQLRSKFPFPFRRLWSKQWNYLPMPFPRLNTERARSSMWKFEAISPTVKVESEKEESSGVSLTNDVKLLPSSPEKDREKCSSLPIRKSEECSVPVVEHFGRRALLGSRSQWMSKRGQLPGKNDFRYYSTVSSTYSLRELATFPKRIEASLKKKEASKRLKKEPFKFMQSATSILVENLLARKKSEAEIVFRGKKRISSDTHSVPLPWKPWFCVDGGIKKNLKGRPENVVYCSQWKKGRSRSDRNLLKDDLRYVADKYLKRMEVRNMLSKLDMKKNDLKVPVKENDCSNRGEERLSSQHSLFRNIGKATGFLSEAGKPLRSVKVLKASQSMGDLPRDLSNNLELYDGQRDIIQYEDFSTAKADNPERGTETNHSKTQELSKRRNKSLRGSTCLKLPSAPISFDRREARTIADRPSRSFRAIIHTRRYAKMSGKPPCNSDKTNKQDLKESNKREKDKSDCTFKKSSNDVKRKNPVDGSCRNGSSNKPGPNCPDD